MYEIFLQRHIFFRADYNLSFGVHKMFTKATERGMEISKENLQERAYTLKIMYNCVSFLWSDVGPPLGHGKRPLLALPHFVGV